ncbi:universal stress protein [Jannaschia formosa]|uniref:universal stress protein n=1 Tax=Jannaschia formosa TaxID=2259592 RepID=UPI000E1C31F6|nr:universal stress protein [Jannaschia formosa]TFL17180.1 hypothetical protein DR046_16000 [Jannaschia formosa]
MTPKTVLACLTDEAGAPALTRTASTLATGWDAHLVGLHVMEGVVFYPRYPVSIPATVYQGIRKHQREQAERLKAVFDKESAGLGARAEWRLLTAGDELPSDAAVEVARAADLVMMSAAEGGQDAHQQRFLQEAVIRGAGRPVLVVPKDGETAGLGRALVGWRDTAQAARALHDLVPLLSAGAAIRLVSFGPGPRLGDAGEVMTDLAATLSRHGFEVEIDRRFDRVESIAGALEAEAREFGADVLAVGAYGHSRAYDLILGAVSRDLLREARIPVLFSR